MWTIQQNLEIQPPKLQAQFPQTNLQKLSLSMWNLNTIKEIGSKVNIFKYQTIRWENLSLTYCDDICREEMKTAFIMEHEFFSLC